MEVASKDSRIRAFSPGRLGRARALNLAIEHATGEYIVQQDFDDISYPERVPAKWSFSKNILRWGWWAATTWWLTMAAGSGTCAALLPSTRTLCGLCPNL